MHVFLAHGAATVGDVFAYREKASALGQPVRPVEFVRDGPPRSAKARVRWLDGDYEGLQAWVPKIRLLCRWTEATALLTDEQHLLAADEASGAPWDTLTYKAVEAVFSAVSPDEKVMFGWRAQERALVLIREPARAAEEFDLTLDALLRQPFAFIDRFGVYRAPFATGEWLAHHFCTTRTEDVLRALGAEELALREAMVTHYYVAPPPSRWECDMSPAYAEERLSEHLRVAALARCWCGATSVSRFDEVQALKGEVERLRDVIKTTGEWLIATGQVYRGRALLRELGIVEKQDRATHAPGTWHLTRTPCWRVACQHVLGTPWIPGAARVGETNG